LDTIRNLCLATWAVDAALIFGVLALWQASALQFEQAVPAVIGVILSFLLAIGGALGTPGLNRFERLLASVQNDESAVLQQTMTDVLAEYSELITRLDWQLGGSGLVLLFGTAGSAWLLVGSKVGAPIATERLTVTIIALCLVGLYWLADDSRHRRKLGEVISRMNHIEAALQSAMDEPPRKYLKWIATAVTAIAGLGVLYLAVQAPALLGA
jgi:hypothetical protein